MSNKIHPQPEYDALNAFDVDNNVKPVRTIAERIAWKYGAGPAHSMVDDIAHALEDARDLGARRSKLEGRPSQSAMVDLVAAIIQDEAKYDINTNTWDAAKAAESIVTAFEKA